MEPKTYEVTGDWRKFHIEEIQSLYFTPNIIRVNKSSRMRLVGHVALTESREYEEYWWVKQGGKRLLRRSRHRWEDNIKKSLKTVRYGVAWIHLAQNKENRLSIVIVLMNFWNPQNAGNFLTNKETVSFSRRSSIVIPYSRISSLYIGINFVCSYKKLAWVPTTFRCFQTCIYFQIFHF